MSKEINLELERVCDLEFDGIDHMDAHDYCDAFISCGSYIIGDIDAKKPTLRELTEEEIDWIMDEYPDFVYEKLMGSIY